MNALRHMVQQLREGLLARSGREFHRAQGRHELLAGYADLAAVLAVLGQEREASYPEREALTRAMLAEHRTTGSAYWSSALLVAYYPLLSRLRHRLVSDTVPREELDQVVVTAFLSALNELSPHELTDRLPMRLRQRTERQVFAYLRRERETHWPLVEQDELGAVEPHRFPEVNTQLLDLSRLLERAADEGLSSDGLAVLQATVVRRELLRSYVERTGPTDEAERERTYQRLKRQRSRTMKRLRALLRVSPSQEASGF
jgi:hypothetical protein